MPRSDAADRTDNRKTRGLDEAINRILSGYSPTFAAFDSGLLEGDQNTTDIISAVNAWWRSNVGQGVLQGVRQLLRDRRAEEEEKERKALDALRTERAAVYRRGVRGPLIEAEDTYQTVMYRYNRAMVAVSRVRMFDKLSAVDVEKTAGLVYLFLDQSSSAEDVAKLVQTIKSDFPGSRLVAEPKDVQSEEVPVDEDVPGFWFIIVSKDPLPEFDFKSADPCRPKPLRTGPPPKTTSVPSDEDQGTDVEIDGDVEVV